MLRHPMVRDKPGGLSLQPPPSPGKLAAQLQPPFGRILVYKCLQMFYVCFILRLRESFDSRFQEGFTIHFKKTRTLGIRLLTTSARLYFRLSLGPPQEEKERGLISRTAASNRAEICCCMYSTAFASISSRALEIEALSFAVNRFRKKTKEPSEPNREKSCFV